MRVDNNRKISVNYILYNESHESLKKLVVGRGEVRG